MAILRRLKTAINALHLHDGSSTNASTSQTTIKADSTTSSSSAVDSKKSPSYQLPRQPALEVQYKIPRQPHDRISKLRSRLTRKPSFFSLRGKARTHEQQIFRAQNGVRSPPEIPKTIEVAASRTVPSIEDAFSLALRSTTPPSPRSSCPEQSQFPSRVSSLLYTILPEAFVQAIKTKQQQRAREGYLHQSQSHDPVYIRMASEIASPPVPYSRLQEITVSACEKALSSINAYSHAATEEWNTTIINSILGTLVTETTPSSSTGSAGQPAFKYVVNSTIIQHAPTSSSGSSDPSVTGRRGMHAASGAYWNNEKDGMWSYKYSAAEKKGLDVVVGVTWIWVG